MILKVTVLIQSNRTNNGKSEEMTQIDRSDARILAAPQSNARQTNRAVATQVGITS